MEPQPRPGVFNVPPYVPDVYINASTPDIYNLSANENLLGPSPNAIASYKYVDQYLEYYPDSSSTKLRREIGKKYKINPKHIVCGTGSEQLINLLSQAYLTVGDEGIHTQYGFILYKVVIESTLVAKSCSGA